MTRSIPKRLLALLLCLAMLVPYLDGLRLPAWAFSGETGTDSREPLAVVGAGSDFQYRTATYNGVTYDSKHIANKYMVKDILTNIKRDYPTMDGFLFCGDYESDEVNNATLSGAGLKNAYEALNETYGLTQDQINFVQGNHDATSLIRAEGNTTAYAYIDPTGAYEFDHYSVFQINEDDFSWNAGTDDTNMTKVAATLTAYLNGKTAENYHKPIFVISHLNLHHSIRAPGGYVENRYTRRLVDAMNAGGEAGLNIIYLYGHNHSGAHDQYLGRDCVYLEPGTVIPVSNEDGAVSSYTDVQISFTYANAGYLGYAGDTLSATVFEIHEDRVVASRYTKDGLVPLKKEGTNTSDANETWPANGTVVESPHTMNLSDITLTVISNTLTSSLAPGATAQIQLGVDSPTAYSVTWEATGDGIVTLTPDAGDPGTVTVTGGNYGVATIEVTVRSTTDPSTPPAILFFEAAVLPENAVCFHGGKDAWMFTPVTDWSTISSDKNYMVMDGNTLGPRTALAGATHNDNERQDPSVFQTAPKIFNIPGRTGVFAVPANDYDVWQLIANEDGSAYRLGQKLTRSNYLAITNKIDANASYSYESGLRYGSSMNSDGAAWWTVDAENKVLDLHSFYDDATQTNMTTATDYSLVWNASKHAFWALPALDTAGSSLYFFEESEKLPKMWIWLTANEGVFAPGSTEVSGAKLAIMLDGVVTELPITQDMLRNAYEEIPGTRPCSVYYGGELITDNFQITVTTEDGTVVEPVEVVVNNGNLFKLRTDNLNGQSFVTVNRNTAGEGRAMILSADGGEYRLIGANAYVMTFEGLDGLYVQAQDDRWIWDQEHLSGSRYYIKSRGGSKYLAADGSVLGLLDAKTEGTDWKTNSTHGTLTDYASNMVIEEDGDGYMMKDRVNNSGGVGYLYVADTELDRVLVYMMDQSGTMKLGGDGTLTSGEVIHRVVYMKDGSKTVTEIPVTLSMLDMDSKDLLIPGNHLCKVTYNGYVVCDQFVVTVETDSNPPATTPVEFTEGIKLLKRMTDQTALANGTVYAFSRARVPGNAPVLTATVSDGEYGIGCAESQVLNVSDSQYLAVTDDSWLWEFQNGKDLYNVGTGKYLSGNKENVLLLRDTPFSTVVWRCASNVNLATTTGTTLEDQTYAYSSDVIYRNGGFSLADRNSGNVAEHTYIYVRKDTIDTLVMYADGVTGQCVASSPGTTEVGGNLIINTLSNGVTGQDVVPITLEMLGLTEIQKVVPGTYTCSVTYLGKEVTSDYQITVNAPEGEKPAASTPVVLIEEGADVFRLYEGSADWHTNGEYVFVDTVTAGNAHILGMTPDGQGGYVPSVHNAQTFSVGSSGMYVVAGADHQIWTAHKTVTTDSGSVSSLGDSWFFVGNTVYGNYLFVDGNYGLQLADANALNTLPNGWRVSTGGSFVTGNGEGFEPYADLIAIGPEFVARHRVLTSGNTEGISFVYVRDDSIVTSLAYADQLTGTGSVNSIKTDTCGGNVLVKTVLNDGSTITDIIPITLDMLSLSYEELHTVGTHTCQVTYRGQVITDAYELTVTNDASLPQADAPVVMFENNGTLFKRVLKLESNKNYVFVDSITPGDAAVMTRGENDTFPAEDTRVFTIDGGTELYVSVKDIHSIWHTEWKYNQTKTAVVYTLYAPDTGAYLHINDQLRLLQVAREDAVPANVGWGHHGTVYQLGYGSSGEIPYATICNPEGMFLATDRSKDTSSTNGAYIYKQEDTLEGQVAYVTALEGSCPVGSSYDVALGGEVVIKTYHTDGTVTTQQVPIDLSMLRGFEPLDLYVAGEHQCSVVYNDKVITDSYTLNIIGDGAAASRPIELANKNSLVFKRVDALKDGEQYVFVNSRISGMGNALSVTEEGGEYVLDAPRAVILEDGNNVLTVVQSQSWIWDADIFTNGHSLYNSTAGQYLRYESGARLDLGSLEGTTVGWRITSTKNLGDSGAAGNHDVVNNGQGFYLQIRNDSVFTGHTYAYQRDDSIELILAYMDSLTGTIQVGQTGMVHPGGNVVIRTFYTDGTSGMVTIPVTLDMLDLTLTQLNTPGTYTTSVTCNGQLITDECQITVTGQENDAILELPGNGTNIMGYVAILDSKTSDILPVASGGRIPTGSTITLYTYYVDGNVEMTEETVTVDMLNATTEQITTPGTYSGLSLTYDNMLICEDYTLRFEEQVSDDYPDFPNEGSVKVDKQMDTTKYNYLQTGTAQIDLSVAGIPTTSKANVVVILDASSSMGACTHGTYASALIDDAQKIIIDKAFAGESLTEEEIAFLQSLDWPSYGADAVAKNQRRMQELIDGTISASDLKSLKTDMRPYGMCYRQDTDTYKWVGAGEENCKHRSIITKEALAELLAFLQQDMEGYDMDIDVAVAYFNQLYATDPDLVFLNDEPVAMVPRSQDELMLPFTNSKEVVIEDVLARYKTISGTNYDRGMEWIYQLLSEKQTADYQEYLAGDTSQPYRARKDFVLFMSDGEPGQYNYMLTNNASEFAHFFTGTIPEDKIDQYVSPENLPAFKEMYHPEGKLWLAEAIKGEKTQKYKVIDPSMPENNYVNYVSGLGATMMTVTLNSYASVMYRIASSEDYYIPTETADDIQQAFGVFGNLVTSGSGSYFMDQMGPEFDLQMNNTIDVANIKDLYKSSTGKWDSYTGQRTTRTIYFDNSHKNWSKVNVYAWDAAKNTLTGSWPGSEMIHLGNGICAYEVPENAVNIIFNDGSSQTADLTIPTDGKSLYRTSTNSWMDYGTQTVYFDATGCSWTEIGCYTWGGSNVSTTGDWPGAKMIHLGGSIYSCEIPADVVDIIFNNNIKNGGSQTNNLTLPGNGDNLYRFSSGTWDTYATRTIYYDNSGSKWSQVRAYTWDANDQYTTSAWPGMEMKHLGNNIYACEIPADAENILFNGGSDANKTGDLTIPATKIHLNSTITVSTYELYKYSEHLHDPGAVTMDMVGKRKGTEPTVLEQITFSDDGTEAYSNLIDGGKTNILIDGVICAKYFWYNTNTGSSVMIDTNGNGTTETLLESETFYWSIDAIPEDELVLSYNVYLTDTLEGLRAAGSYATNDYASLYYINHLGNPCQLDTTSPMLPWNQAVVGYAFYLVDAEGNPIVNEDQHLTGSFEKSIRMTQPLYIDLLYNSDENVEPFQLVAKDVLPAGYSLYDSDAAYHVKLYADGEGGWNITNGKTKLTTYVTGYGGVPTTQVSATSGMSTEGTYDYPAYATASTVVWFAVRADVNAVPDTVVIDYGLSVDIHVLGNDVVITDQNSVIAGIGGTCPEDTDGNGVVFAGTLAEGFGSGFTGQFGTAAVRGNVVRYTPNTLQMTAEDTFYYSAEYRGQKNAGYYYSAVTVIPATTIYYEDNFITFDENWTQVGQTLDGIQDEDRLGTFSLPQIDANNVYGHDSAYDDMQTWSLGSVMKTTVSDTGIREAIAQFTFTGTGFDIISYTSADTGVMMLTVQGITDPSYSKMLVVDSYYSLSDGLYQVPIMKLQDLPYGEYWVELYVGYGWTFDHASDGAYDFYLDAIRIYDPAGDGQGNTVIEDAYMTDGEGWPSYQELRNLLITMDTFDSLGQEDEISGLIFIDGNAALEDDNASGKPGTEMDTTDKSAIADYANYGPNNELYLAPGQAVAFRLNVDSTDENVAGIHLGLKSVGGTARVKVYNAAVNHAAVKEQRLSSATQQYYDITELDGSTVVIWNVGGEGDAVLSVTDIKTTYQHQPKNTGRISFTINRSAAAQALSSMEAEQTAVPSLTLKYPSLSFEGEIRYNVHFEAQNLEGAQLGLAVFNTEELQGTVDTASDVIWGAGQQDGLYMTSTNGIPAKNMGDRVYFKVFAKLPDGSYIYSDMRSYSAVDYATNALATGTQAQKALVVAMLNYGAQAQSYFGHDTDQLMNASLTAEDQKLVSGFNADELETLDAVDPAKAGAFSANGGYIGKYPAVYFDGAFQINYNMLPANPVEGILTLYYWNEDTYSSAEALTAENADGKIPMFSRGGTWQAAGGQIAAKDLDKTVYAAVVYESDGVSYSTGILNYSIAAYCQSQSAESDMNAFADAAAVYGCAAKAYFG